MLALAEVKKRDNGGLLVLSGVLCDDGVNTLAVLGREGEGDRGVVV